MITPTGKLSPAQAAHIRAKAKRATAEVNASPQNRVPRVQVSVRSARWPPTGGQMIYGLFAIRNQSTRPIEGFRSPRSGIDTKLTLPYVW